MFEHKRFSTYDELNTFISKNIDKKYVYRGYSGDKQLEAKVFRCNESHNEFDYLIEFEKYAPLLISINNATSLYILAQHYNLPTRLIDFTYNPYVALYFALNNYEEKQEFNIIMIDKTNLNGFCFSSEICSVNGAGIKIADAINLSNLTENIKNKILQQEKSGNNLPMLFETNYTNNRIYFQQGLFLITFSKDDLKNMENNNNVNGFILSLEFNKDERKKALGHLEIMGINDFRLMYDLDSLSKSIKDKIHSKSKQGE